MKKIIFLVMIILTFGIANAQIGEVKNTTSTSYEIYNESGQYIGSIGSWSNCEMVGYTSKYVVIWCDSYSTYVYDHKGNQYATKGSSTGCGKCTIISVTPSGITYKRENGEKTLYNFNLSPK